MNPGDRKLVDSLFAGDGEMANGSRTAMSGPASLVSSEDSIQWRMGQPPYTVTVFFASSAGRRSFRSASSENGF
jgi:hypothetical protein